jgi:hypothetical protein
VSGEEGLGDADVIEGMFGIRVRKDGEARARWLASEGGEMTRRIHALVFEREEIAERVAGQLRKDNEGFAFTVAAF